MTNRDPLTQNELRALAYFGVGVTSEGSVGGRDLAYRLSFAGNVMAGGRMDPVGNSGYSFGTLQIDLGQHPKVARDFLDSYQRWAVAQPDSARLTLRPNAYSDMLASLQRTGRQMETTGAVDIDRTQLNRFLASDAGQTFIHGLDVQHATRIAAVDGVRGNSDSALERLQRTDLYRNASGEDQAQLAGMFMKLQNQAGNARWPEILRKVEGGTLGSAEDVKSAIDGLLRNQRNGTPDYLQSGADNTLRGVAVFNALRNAHPDNPLAQAWANVSANPLMGPVEANERNLGNPSLGFEYRTIRSLFLTPEASGRLISALDRGATLSEGDPQLRNGRRQAGFYVVGNDFVHWNRNGEGNAYIAGRWQTIDPDNLQRVRGHDGTLELRTIDREGRVSTLLTVNHRAPVLRAELREDSAQGPFGTDAVSRMDSGSSVHWSGGVNLNHLDNALLQQIRHGVRALDRDAGKRWDDASERLSAGVLLVAKKHGFTARDELHLEFNQPTDRYSAGEILHLFRRGPTASSDPAANHVYVKTLDALSRTPEDNFARLDAIRQVDLDVAAVRDVERAIDGPVHGDRTMRM